MHRSLGASSAGVMTNGVLTYEPTHASAVSENGFIAGSTYGWEVPAHLLAMIADAWWRHPAVWRVRGGGTYELGDLAPLSGGGGGDAFLGEATSLNTAGLVGGWGFKAMYDQAPVFWRLP